MRNAHLRLHLIAIACAAATGNAWAQDSSGSTRIEVTGSLIKRTDRETPSVLQTITREDIQRSPYATLDDLMRTVSASDSGAISDGKASGFISGISTNSMRGFGSQSTLTLINGRRVAPVAAVDINFGRGTLVSVNTLPKGAIERIEILKDGASAMYGSDAIVGVVNYILRRDYQGGELSVSAGSNDQGAGRHQQFNGTFGFGDLDRRGINVYGGFDFYRRERVASAELLDKGYWDLNNVHRQLNGAQPRYSHDTVASNPGNYYSVPQTFPATTTVNGIRTTGNSISGPLFLGGMPGCPDADTVGKGAPARYPSFASDTPSFPAGMCRLVSDNYLEALAEQERANASLRVTFALTPTLTGWADLMLSKTKTVEDDLPQTLTTALVTSRNPVATTWPTLSGVFRSQNAIILPVGHPDNPTNGKPNAQQVQLLYRFTDLPNLTIQDLQSTRITAGLTGTWGDWDFDSALVTSRQENQRVRANRLRSSLLTQAIASGSYRFGGTNDAAARASVSSDAVVDGESTVTSLDLRASRSLFALPGGPAALAVGVEARREKMKSTPNQAFLDGDFIGLVANGTEGERSSYAAFAEIGLPLRKNLELQAALRHEKFSDFGNTTTGKLGFKWGLLPSTLVLRGTAATGFRAPSISQISNSFASSFHSSQDERIFDPIRCDSSNPNAPVSRAPAPVTRDCNVLNFSAVSGATPGNLATIISGNPSLKAETSRSATAGLLFSPNRELDIGLDYWYFERNDEIRAQRGIDIMRAYIGNQAAYAAQVIRDPNPASWLTGVANSGPILGLIRQYGNFLWSKTSGFDYDLVWRIPATDWGRFTLKIQGTRTWRFDRQIVADQPIERIVGTTANDVPRNKFSISLRHQRNAWDSFVRVNHTGSLVRTGTTATCLASSSAANTYLRDNGWCGVTTQTYFDIGTNWAVTKNFSVSAAVINVFDKFGGTQDVPAIHNFYYDNNSDVLGRRFNVTVNYKFF